MPWMISKRSGKFIVHKQGSDGQPMGNVLGTHESEADAKKQLAALYASETQPKAVKFVNGSDEIVEGPGLPFGGPFAGSDLDGQRFTARTDFCFDWFGPDARPALWHHGLDNEAGAAVVGRVKSWEVKSDLGVWTRVQLDKQGKYFQAIKQMIAAGKLYFSSGAMAHLVEVLGTGEIKRWPWVELSFTPTPSNLLASVSASDVAKHFKSADLEIPEHVKAQMDAAMKMAPAAMMAMMREMAGEMGMEMSDAEMKQMMAGMDPEMPEAEMRAEMKKKLEAHQQEMGAKSASLKALPGSYEELLEKLSAAINPFNPFAAPGRWARVEATFSDYFIACLCDGQEEKMYRVAYTTSPDGETVTLGKMTEVEETYVPVAKAASLVPERLAEHTELVVSYAAALAQRTKDLGERRTKEGRVLSIATRKRLSDCVGSMRGAMEELMSLLDNTDPAKAEAKAAFGRLAIDIDLLEFEAALTA